MNICIIKLGADGDVLRTLPLAKALKEKYPNSEITWITKGDVSTLLTGNPYINHILTLPYIAKREFDILYNFDIENEATQLAGDISAKQKYGFYAEDGYVHGFNLGAEYYINTVFDDDIKKTNRKTYQEMMFDIAELEYKKEHCPIFLTQKDREYATCFASEHGVQKDKLIGIHIGASSRWPSKAWAMKQVQDFIIKAKREGYEVLLFGGPNETDKHEEIVRLLAQQGIRIYRNNSHNTKREFAALVNLCSLMVCADSFALHVALALEKRVVGLFFCTSPHEIEGYGFMRAVVSPLLDRLFPARMDEYDEEVVNSISPDQVLSAVESLLKG